MASATKSIQSACLSQRIPAEKHKPSELSAAFWILIYASTALIVVTTAILVAACVSVSMRLFGDYRGLRRGQHLDRRMKS
jgi:hypothetical protein